MKLIIKKCLKRMVNDAKNYAEQNKLKYFEYSSKNILNVWKYIMKLF